MFERSRLAVEDPGGISTKDPVGVDRQIAPDACVDGQVHTELFPALAPQRVNVVLIRLDLPAGELP